MGSLFTTVCGPPPATREYRAFEPVPYVSYEEKMRQAWLDFYAYEDEMAWLAYTDCFDAFEGLIDNFFEEIDWEAVLEKWDSEDWDSELLW